MIHFVYIIFSKSANMFYVGETCNVIERIIQHNSGFYNSSFTKRATDWELFWQIECESKEQALKIECHIKKMRNRNYYNNLVRFPEMAVKLLERFKL